MGEFEIESVVFAVACFCDLLPGITTVLLKLYIEKSVCTGSNFGKAIEAFYS